MSIDYANTWFYKLACKDLTILDCYIGYSTFKFERTSTGLRDTSKSSGRTVFKFIRKHGGFENFNITQIASRVCDNKSEALSELRRYHDEYKPTLNGRIPSRGQSEYYQTNKQKILEDRREYLQRPNVAASILEQKRGYYIKTER
jgi:hypothetical protein